MQCRAWLKRWRPHSFMKSPATYFREGCLGSGAATALNASFLRHNKTRRERVTSASAKITNEVLHRLNRTRLIFLGDSLSLEHFVSTVCFLVGPMPSLMEPPNFEVRVGDDPDAHYCLTLRRDSWSEATLCFLEWFGKVKHRVRPPWIAEQYDADIKNRTLAAMNMMATVGWTKGLMGHVVQTWDLGQRDRVVANLGLMFGSRPGPLLVQAVSSFLAAYRALPNESRFTMSWRETAPQHFPTKSGFYSNASLMTCTRGAVEDGFNALTNPLVTPLGLDTLRVWRSADLRFQQHPLEHSPNDCTHYCLPGAVLGNWALAIVRRLLHDGSTLEGDR